MAIQTVNLFPGSRPLDGNCFFAPYSLENSGTTQDPDVLHMIAAVVSMIKGITRVPDLYFGSPVV